MSFSDNKLVIVRCKRTPDPVVATPDPLAVGHDYVVLGVSARPRGRHSLMLMLYTPEDRKWRWHEAQLFESVSDVVPSSWTIRLDDNVLFVCPRVWQRSGFWDDLFLSDLDTRPANVKTDASRRAWIDYYDELDEMLRAEGVDAPDRPTWVTAQ